MKTINFGNVFNREKFEELFKLYFIGVISSWILLGFLMVIDLIVSASFTDKICTYMAVINLILLMPLPIWIILRILLDARQSSNKNKIFVTNNLAEISTNKSNEPKYTEKDVITIVNRLIRNSNNPEKGNLAAATFYASTINNADSLTSSSWGNQQNWRTSTASSTSKLSSIYSNWDTSIGSSSSPRCHYDYSDSNRIIRDYYHDCYYSPSHPMYKIYHST